MEIDMAGVMNRVRESAAVQKPQGTPTPVTDSTFGLLPHHFKLEGIDSYDWGDNGENIRIVKLFLLKLPHVNAGLYLYGSVGYGKSTLACIIGNRWNEAWFTLRKIDYEAASEDEKLCHFAAARLDINALWEDRVMPVHWPDAIMAAKGLYHPENLTKEQQRMLINMDNASSRYLWILDDFGTGKMTEHAQEYTDTFLRKLYNNDCRVIITSNRTPDSIKTLYGDAIRSRLKEMCFPLKFEGKDRRDRG